ncbi:hypothetical protein AB9E29_09530 [Rhizobium leguminosarum]|uniref:hypothetical protein n=1 Tax=Rhizobium leguminosarum TaxID=384 RepID=UPI003F9E3448
MAEIFHFRFPKSLLGTWRSLEDDARSQYSVSIEKGKIVVTGEDYLDGEGYTISNITYDDDRVEFDTFMESTGRVGHLVLLATSDSGKAEMRFTFTDITSATKIEGC